MRFLKNIFYFLKWEVGQESMCGVCVCLYGQKGSNSTLAASHA